MSRGERFTGRRGRYDDDDDDLDRPRRKHQRSKKRGRLSPIAIVLIAGGGAICLIGAAVVLYLVVFSGGAGSGGGLLGKSPPRGYSSVPGHSAGFTCFLPGEVRSIRVFFNGVPGDQAGIYGWEGQMPAGNDGPNRHASATSHRLRGYSLGNSADELLTELKKHDPKLNGDFFYEITAKNAITLGGKGALELRYKAKATAFGVPVTDPAELAKNEREGEKGVYLVTTDGNRFFIIKLSLDGPSIDEEIIRIVRDSFEFR